MFRYALIAAAALASLPAEAQDRSAVRKACQADLAAHCAGIQPGGGRILACVQENKAKFSPDCLSAMQAAAAQRKQ